MENTFALLAVFAVRDTEGTGEPVSAFVDTVGWNEIIRRVICGADYDDILEKSPVYAEIDTQVAVFPTADARKKAQEFARGVLLRMSVNDDVAGFIKELSAEDYREYQAHANPPPVFAVLTLYLQGKESRLLEQKIGYEAVIQMVLGGTDNGKKICDAVGILGASCTLEHRLSQFATDGARQTAMSLSQQTADLLREADQGGNYGVYIRALNPLELKLYENHYLGE